jgi:hypothetical protein
LLWFQFKTPVLIERWGFLVLIGKYEYTTGNYISRALQSLHQKNDVLFDCPHASCEGIYLWAVRMKSGSYKVSYIGETGVSYYRRTKDHLIQIFGGNYQVCDPESLLNGKNEVIWNGLWRKGTRDKLPEFFSQYERLTPIIKRSIVVQKVFVAPIKITSRLRIRIEGALAIAI